MFIGIVASFIGATLQAINYILTQNCQQKYNIDGVKLLVATHAAMGFFALIPAILFDYWRYIHPSQYIDFIKINLPYLIAQYLLIRAIKLSDASVASPLLALKIPVLALISWLVLQQSFSIQQWGAIAIIVAMAWRFSTMSGDISLKPLLLVFIACIGYSCSDLAVTDFSHRVPGSSPIEKVMVTMTINYLVVGVLSLPLMVTNKVSITMVYQAKWVGFAWFSGVILLVIGFNLSGVVSGNIVQSLRGIIGIALAFVFFRHQINQPMSLWKNKMITALIMVAAIGLFYI
ncbi:EamA family transporter [Vibrio sp. 99-8-1]|uniref:EamA family transporter n=1 Tax=Vibrio sp. 99-8-1 TaxID=2607602 RepID=UPI001493C386|nr:EamA family transporter [Vibrio sp. 99-8-1]NOI66709.1 EamA family transporter [Vibrio sp. 99-8-1]